MVFERMIGNGWTVIFAESISVIKVRTMANERSREVWMLRRG